MRKILITGENGYIGQSLFKHLNNMPQNYYIETISLRSDDWRKKPLTEFDVIVHLAAIVHSPKTNGQDYYRTNRDLTIELANKAKEYGVQQFIFLSTMGVYGMEAGHIGANTQPNPKTHYAKSKLEAESELLRMSNDHFLVSIIRPPIVYGKDCPGNYSRLSLLARWTPIFPMINNSRSMIFIDNLTEFIKTIIDKKTPGILFPQNKEYVNTTNLVELINKENKKSVFLSFALGSVTKLLLGKVSTIDKVFGSLTYDKSLPGGPLSSKSYEVVSFEKSISLTEKQRLIKND